VIQIELEESLDYVQYALQLLLTHLFDFFGVEGVFILQLRNKMLGEGLDVALVYHFKLSFVQDSEQFPHFVPHFQVFGAWFSFEVRKSQLGNQELLDFRVQVTHEFKFEYFTEEVYQV
jgi:hypothetical protein